MGPELLTLTGEDYPDDVYAGGVQDDRDVSRNVSTMNLPAIRYGENQAITWVKQNPLIAAAVVVAAVIIISKMKKRGR
jgi:hypothetical protein